MSKKPVSAKVQKSNTLRNTIIGFAIIIIAVAVAFALISHFGAKNTPVDTDQAQAVEIHGIVTDMNDETIAVEVYEPHDQPIEAGSTVLVPASAQNELRSPNLAVGDEVTVYFDGTVNHNDETGEVSLPNVFTIATGNHEINTPDHEDAQDVAPDTEPAAEADTEAAPAEPAEPTEPAAPAEAPEIAEDTDVQDDGAAPEAETEVKAEEEQPATEPDHTIPEGAVRVNQVAAETVPAENTTP